MLAALAPWVAPLAAQAQPRAKPYRIGVIASTPQALQQSLAELGYVDGRDIVFENRNPQGRPELFDRLALELVRLKVDVIVASNPPAVASVKRATTTIPVVMMHTPDPVEMGFVASLARPGGNITGVTTLSAELSIKQLELLREALPRMSRLALVFNPENPWHPATAKALERRAGAAGLQLDARPVRSADAIAAAFGAMAAARAQAVLLLADPLTFVHRSRVADLAVQHRLPMMAGLPEYADAGALMSYWADVREVNRRAASYVDKILKGARPGDLPIEQPTTFELVANLRTARALGLTLPPSIVQRADRLIE